MRLEDSFPVRSVSTGATLEVVLEVVLGVVVLIAPYYWLPGMSVASLSLIKNALVVSLGLIWIACVVANGRVRTVNRRLSLLLILFPVALLPGLLGIPSLAAATTYLNYLLVIVVFLIATGVILRRGIRAVDRFYLVAILAMVPQALYVTVATFGLIDPISVPDVFRNPSEPYGAGFSAVQTQFATSLSLTVPLLAGYVFGNFDHPSSRRRYAYAALFLPVAVALVGSQGRAGMLAALTGLFVFALLWERRLFLKVGTGLGVTFGGILLVAPAAFFRITKLDKGLSAFTSNRLSLFSDALTFVLENPLTGLGYGNRPFAVDNLYLALSVESGVFAGIAAASLIATACLEGFRSVAALRGTEYESMAIGLFAAIIAFVPPSLFQRGAILSTFYINVSWWVCLACLLTLPHLAREPR